MRLRSKPLDPGRQLDAVPVRNAHVRTMPGAEPGELRLELTLRYTGWRGLLARVLKPRTVRHFALEGIGREVYEAIDGVSTFEQLADAFAARHKLTFLEASGLLAQYYRTLIARGLVAVALPPAAAAR